MLSADYRISPQDLWNLIGTDRAPQLVDVRRQDFYEASPHLLPGSVWRRPETFAQWMPTLDRERPIVVACKAGKELSQFVTAELRGAGYQASMLEGGYAGWEEAGLPFVDHKTMDRFAPQRPSVWVTRRQPKIDRIACPWLIQRFIDPQARILFVDPAYVKETANEVGGIPFDIEGVELGHEGPRCSFDTILKLFGLEAEPHLARLALIVRGADTARHDLAPEASGLHAISLGLSALAGDDDHGLLRKGFMVYDALFAWLRHAAAERHNWPAKAA
jgi:rhodanese-related sulfurtransferase